MRDGGYPDNIRDFDHMPGSPFYPSSVGEEEAAEREERFGEAADELEAIANWLGEVWDQPREDARDSDDMVDDAERLVMALRAALAPWKKEIIAHEQKLRAKYGVTAPMKLMGETLPGLRR